MIFTSLKGLMSSYPSSNTSLSSVLFQEKFFQIPASEILTNSFLQQKMEMTMNTLSPPGRKLGQLAVVLEGDENGKGLLVCYYLYKVLEFSLCLGKNQKWEMLVSIRGVLINLFWYISLIVEVPVEEKKVMIQWILMWNAVMSEYSHVKVDTNLSFQFIWKWTRTPLCWVSQHVREEIQCLARAVSEILCLHVHILI